MKRNTKYSPYAGVFHRIILSNRCKVCMKLIPINDELCDTCDVEKLRIKKETLELRSYADSKIDRLTSPFYYSKDTRKCIHNLKYKGFKRAADFLADEMIKVIERDFFDEEPDFITCVPEHKRKKKRMYFNHGKALSKRVANAFGYKHTPNLILKIKDTPQQAGLNQLARKNNVKGAFKANAKYNVKGKTVLICDDVITTSSTLNECAKALKKAGAARVICATATLSNSNSF